MLLLLLACTRSDPAPTGDDTPTTSVDSEATGDTASVDTDTDTDGPTADTGESGDSATTTACVEAGCVVQATSLGRFSREQLQAVVAPDLVLDNGYEVFVVDYLTEGDRVATATVTLPIDVDAPAEGWSTVANAHGTIGLDDPCRLSGTVSGSGLAGLFGARGTIGVAPDYLGIGGPGVHRYLDLYDEAVAVLDSIRAARHLAVDEGLVVSERAAVVGLSQGGHATLAAATWHSRYAPELDLRAFGAVGPASGFVEHWSTGVSYDGAHQALHAMLMWSFAEAAGVDDSPLWAAGFDPESVLLSRCGWDPDFSGDPTLYEGFPTAGSDVFSADFLPVYSAGSFTGFEYVADAFERNRIRPWLDDAEQTAPIRIWQGTLDDVVPLYATQELVDDLVAGGIDVELVEVPGGGHVDVGFGFVASSERATDETIAWVKERLAE